MSEPEITQAEEERHEGATQDKAPARAAGSGKGEQQGAAAKAPAAHTPDEGR